MIDLVMIDAKSIKSRVAASVYRALQLLIAV